MSIIYDALQKTQKNRDYLKLHTNLGRRQEERSQLESVFLVIFILILSAGVGALLSIYWEPIKTSAKPHAVVKKYPAVKAAPVTKSAEPVTQQSAHLWVTDNRKASQSVHEVSVPPVTEKPLVARNDTLVASVQQPPSPLPLLQTPQENASQPQASTRQIMNSANLTLNGVLISDSEKIALINNQSFHLGDMVLGMKIVGIELNHIKLQSGQQILELRVPV